MALGGLRVPGREVSRFWMRWILVMLATLVVRLCLKVWMASWRVLGWAVSKKMNRLSGRLDTYMVELSASLVGGRILSWAWASLSGKSLWFLTLVRW